jgi:hypothetical protein
MAKKRLKIQAGNTTINMNNELANMAEDLLNRLMPDTKREIEKQIDRIEKDARARWPVRDKKSKNSKGKIYSEIRLTSDLKLVAVVGNKAEYAWAIRVGEDTKQTRLKENQRVSHHLLWKPVRIASDDMARALADETVKMLRK